MEKGRLEAFSDGVIAVIITIMVLELKIPAGGGLRALLPVYPVFLSYVLSFIMVGVYWNNHHHMLQAARKVDGKVLWANLHLLFWMSLLPFATAWMGSQPHAPWPFITYGIIMLLAGIAYILLTHSLIRVNGKDSTLARAVQRGTKEKLSLAGDVLAIALAFVRPWMAAACLAGVAAMWLLPDRRIETAMRDDNPDAAP